MSPAADARDSRTRLLDAGVALFFDLTLADVLAGLNVSKVARRARVTRPTFYAHWSTQAAFVDDLVAHVLDPGRTTLTDEVVGAMTAVASRNDGIVDSLRTILRADIELLRSDADFQFEQAVWSKCDDARVGRELARYYGMLDDDLVGGYEMLLTRWNREPRPPFTLQQIAVVLDALVVGMVQRRRIEPELATPRLFEDTVLLLLPRVTRRIGDTETVEELVDEVERFADDVARTAGTRPGSAVVHDLDQIVADIDAHAVDADWLELSLDDVASVVGTSKGQLLTTFGSRAGLGSALLERRIELTFAAEQPGDAGPSDRAARSSVAALRSTLALLRRVCATHVGYTLGAVGVAVRYLPGPDLTDPAGRVVTRLGELVSAAQRAEELAPGPDPVALATSLVRIVITDTAAGGSPGIEPEQLLVDALAT